MGGCGVHRRAVGLAIALAAVALAVPACGGGDDASEGAAPTTTAEDTAETDETTTLDDTTVEETTTLDETTPEEDGESGAADEVAECLEAADLGDVEVHEAGSFTGSEIGDSVTVTADDGFTQIYVLSSEEEAEESVDRIREETAFQGDYDVEVVDNFAVAYFPPILGEPIGTDRDAIEDCL